MTMEWLQFATCGWQPSFHFTNYRVTRTIRRKWMPQQSPSHIFDHLGGGAAKATAMPTGIQHVGSSFSPCPQQWDKDKGETVVASVAVLPIWDHRYCGAGRTGQGTQLSGTFPPRLPAQADGMVQRLVSWLEPSCKRGLQGYSVFSSEETRCVSRWSSLYTHVEWLYGWVSPHLEFITLWVR
jgi:hypothetical protein